MLWRPLLTLGSEDRKRKSFGRTKGAHVTGQSTNTVSSVYAYEYIPKEEMTSSDREDQGKGERLDMPETAAIDLGITTTAASPGTENPSAPFINQGESSAILLWVFDLVA